MMQAAQHSRTYGAGGFLAVAAFFKRTGDYSGYSNRSEFWWSLCFISMVAASLFSLLLGMAMLATFAASAHSTSQSFLIGTVARMVELQVGGILGLSFTPSLLALLARRYHDAGFSKWLLPLHLMSLIGLAIGTWGISPWIAAVTAVVSLLAMASWPSRLEPVRFQMF